MKFYKKLVLDIQTGRHIEAECFDYDGPIAELKGQSTKSTTTVNVPPPTADETRAKNLANLINEQNLRDSGYDLIEGEGGVLSLRERPLTQEQQQQRDFETKLQQQIQQRLLGGPVDPETRKLVDETFGATRDLGNEEISRFMREQAGARGLDLATDTPALKELGLAKSRLETGLGGARAASLLDAGNRQQLFAASLNEFQANLKQQAFMNRAMIGESFAQTGLGLSRERFGQASSTTRNKTSGGGFNIAGMLQGGMSGAMAGGQAGGPWGAVGGGLAGGALGGFGGGS